MQKTATHITSSPLRTNSPSVFSTVSRYSGRMSLMTTSPLSTPLRRRTTKLSSGGRLSGLRAPRNRRGGGRLLQRLVRCDHIRQPRDLIVSADREDANTEPTDEWGLPPAASQLLELRGA